MGSAVGILGTNPDSTEDSEDMSQDGEDTGEREATGIAMGRIGEGQTRPSSLRASPSAYLLVTIISVHARVESKRKYLETKVVRSEG